jgi:ABC-type uncharacterized transport system substrate-binding protein
LHARRRLVLAALAVAGIATATRSVSQQSRVAPVIGLLGNDAVKPSPFATGLIDVLRDRGLVAGRDFQVEDRVTLEGYGDYAESMAELIRAKVSVIVTNGATATVAAAKATKQIPIVMISGADPVASGLVASLSRPGANVTGIYSLAAALNAKRMELLKELNPGLTSVGVLLATNVGNTAYVREAEEAARVLDLQLHFSQARTPEDIEDAIAELAKMRVGAFFVSPGTMLLTRSTRVVGAVAKHRLPAVYAGERYIDAGALLVYSPSRMKNLARVAGYVDRILKGASPGELAVEQSADLELAVNLKTARALGIRIPQSILARADRVID